MKRLITAAALLLLLIFASVWNIRRVDALTGELETLLARSEQAALDGSYELARGIASEALARWLASDSYTHIFIRHSEIDSTSDAFYELLGQVAEGDGDGLPSAYAKLIYHLDSIASMEHVSIGSIF